MGIISSTFLEEVKKCRKCSTIIGYKNFSADTHGNLNSNYMLVSEAPGKWSLCQAKYWVGSGGKILRTVASELHVTLEELFYLTDIVKCWPNEYCKNRKPYKDEINNCADFLLKEIDLLQPKLILALGKVVAEFLIRRDIRLNEYHGKVLQLNQNTKVLVMYHPSGIDRFMKRELYKTQLKFVFAKLSTNDLSSFERIFMKNQNEKVKQIISNISNQYLGSKKMNFANYFILPAPGNAITENDISENQLRITVDFKSHFPDSNSVLTFQHDDSSFDVNFTHRVGKSHILHLGRQLMGELNLRKGDQVKITKIDTANFSIEKVN